MPELQHDAQLRMPNVTILKASAGSGKTYALTLRYVQFLLSRRIRPNDLRSILAITFANNASREMREKVLEWLKLLYFGDPARREDVTAVTDGIGADARARADELIQRILSRYSDFQVRTIDSFMSMIFRASALDFGFGPEMEIVLEPAALQEYAFNRFLRGAREGSAEAALLDRTISEVFAFMRSADSFPWDPAAPLLEKVTSLDAWLANCGTPPVARDVQPLLRQREEAVRAAMRAVSGLMASSGLEASKRSTFPRILASVQAGRFSDLIGAGMKTCPVNKPKTKDPAALARYGEIQEAWAAVEAETRGYTACYARAFYQPFLRLHAGFAETVRKVKQGQGKVFIGDIGRALGGFLSREIVPDVYFSLGERIFHFLMDEFQDTSPLQWNALFPLVENSLSNGGSLFVVGDTKQAIYGFRNADYRIMQELATDNPFPSIEDGPVMRELTVSQRSRPRVLALAKEIFRVNAAGSPAYGEASRRSGLADWELAPKEGDDPGYAEVRILDRDDERPPEKETLIRFMGELKDRGYGWGDIALLAERNDDIVRATSWLNEAGIPFLSFSSLDMRKRGVAAEILALLSFLESPPDDLAFATFLRGSLFGRALAAGGADPAGVRDFLYRARDERPLYKAFQRRFPELWKEHFSDLFRSTGYLPLYDLVSEAFIRFDVFSRAAEEEATLAKLLETVRDFEGSGSNSLRGFLGEADDESGKWALSVPSGAQSVRAMTVHKAKGLGFPVVILLLYGHRGHGFEYAMLPDDDGPQASLVRINEDIAASDPALRDVYDEMVMKGKVQALNTLYVGLTRAKRELYVVGVKRDRDDFPFSLLPRAGFEPRDDKGPAARAAAPAETRSAVSHYARQAPPPAAAGQLARRERRRGELAHRMLELLGAAPADVEAALAEAGRQAAREAREDPAEAEAVSRLLLAMIRGTEAGALFAAAPGRSVLIEQEFCDSEGRLVRMDRVIVEAGAVTVVDFKTGDEDREAHGKQLERYARILSEVYPGRAVSALAAYIDLGMTRRIA